MSRAARCSRCPARRSIRAPRAPTASGATPVTETADIISVLQPIMGLDLPAREPAAAGEEPLADAEPNADERSRIIALLSPAPVLIDDLVRLSKTTPRVVRMVLLELELAGRLDRHGGGLVSLV